MSLTSEKLSFTPAELAGEKLLADEMSWRRAKDLPVDKKSVSLSETADSKFGSCSVGEFFREKCEPMDEIFSQISPERSRAPMPLVDSSYMSDNPVRDSDYRSINKGCSIAVKESTLREDNNLLSVSHIQKVTF